MGATICKVVNQSPVVMVQSRKQEVGQMAKSTLRLKEVGSTNEFLCTLLGGIAEFQFESGQIVTVGLRFTVRDGTNGGQYQDITASDIVLLT